MTTNPRETSTRNHGTSSRETTGNHDGPTLGKVSRGCRDGHRPSPNLGEGPEVDDGQGDDVDDLFRQLAEARAARIAAEADLAAERARQGAEADDAHHRATAAVRAITETRAAIAEAHALTVRTLAAHLLSLARRALARHGLPATEPDALALIAAAPGTARDGLKVDPWGVPWVHEPPAEHALDVAARYIAAHR